MTGGLLSFIVRASKLLEVEFKGLEELVVTPEGFDESCLSQVFVDLVEERAELRGTEAR